MEIVLTVLGAAGGAGTIIAGLGAWLGKVWADRMAQMQKLSGDIDLDLRQRRIGVYTELWEATRFCAPLWQTTLNLQEGSPIVVVGRRQVGRRPTGGLSARLSPSRIQFSIAGTSVGRNFRHTAISC